MTRRLSTLAFFIALCLVSVPAQAQNPFSFGTVFIPNQNQMYPAYGWSNANYGNYGSYGYGNYGYGNYGYRQSYRNHYTPSGRGSYPTPSPGSTYSVPTYGGSIQVQHLGLPGLQNVITLPPGYTVQSY